ncbi:hypothetical protein [Acidovorax radicis]|uniref:hypothetical protein n=1 Tax=Acidovorax radicis TaxID=758826 RepID=UPI001CFB642A|nr:hypothetical protein [Acidovorax radicis]
MVVSLVLAGCQAPMMPKRVSQPPPDPTSWVTTSPAANAPTDADSSPSAAPTTPATADPVQRVLAQTDRILSMPAPELGKEIARLSATEETAAEKTLVLAIALSHTRQAVDTARALGLVQRVLANNATDEAQALQPLARLVEARLLQQRRLEDQLEKQSQQLRDTQRRNDQLNERLEAVRAIERSLTTRPVSPPSAPAPAPGSNTQRPAP